MKPTYSFYIRKNRKNKQNKVPIYFRVTYNRKLKYVNTGIKIEEQYWNETREEVRKSHVSVKMYNEELRMLRVRAERIGFELERNNNLSAKNIVDQLKGKKPANFVKYTRNYIKRLKQSGNIRLSKQTSVVLNKIIRFSKTDSIEFGEMNRKYLDNLQLHLKNKIGNHPNTVRKDFERLKMIFREADEDNLLTENPFDKYKLPPRQKSKKEALTFEQIKAIDRLEFERGSNLFHAKNYFMFSFYNAGIRFGDLCKLKWSNIQDGRLKYVMSKSLHTGTPKWKNIKLNDFSFEILKHYRKSGSDDDYIFPILDTSKDLRNPAVFDSDKTSKNVMVNKLLKKVAKKAGIQLKLSFHISRHSFARHAANMGMNVYAISNALAHSDLKTTQTYLNSFNESLLDKEMSSIF